MGKLFATSEVRSKCSIRSTTGLVGKGRVAERLGDADAGIVAKDVDPPESRFSLISRTSIGWSVCDIVAKEMRAPKQPSLFQPHSSRREEILAKVCYHCIRAGLMNTRPMSSPIPLRAPVLKVVRPRNSRSPFSPFHSEFAATGSLIG